MKLKPLLLIAVLFVGSLNCAFALGSGSKALGDITLKNGQKYDAVLFEMPLDRDKQVKVQLNGANQKIETDSIQYILLWNEKHPEEKYIFKPFYVEHLNLKTGETTVDTKPLWLYCEQVSPHASLWVEIGRPSFKKDKLKLSWRSTYSWTSMNYILKNGHDNPCHIPDKEKDVKQWMASYFSDDPEALRRLDTGKYDASDFGRKYTDIRRFIEEYAPKR